MSEIKVLFVYPYHLSTFIQRDLDILRKHFEVRALHYTGIMKSKNPLKWLPSMINGVIWADVTFSWFADSHSLMTVLLSNIFRKTSIVVVGGYEVANVPEIGYGGMLNPITKRIVRFVLKHADKVLTVDDALKKDAIRNFGVNGKNIQTIPTGYDINRWKPEGKKEDLVVTVGHVNFSTLKKKGFETFVKSARYLPNVKFVLIGKHVDDSINHLKDAAPSNVEFTGFVSDKELLKWYQRAKVYCQLSRYEGLPTALCEAMACECVPVGTKRCGIPTAIGNTGFYVPYGDEKATAKAIKKALGSDKGEEARERIKNIFPIERREKELIKIIRRIDK